MRRPVQVGGVAEVVDFGAELSDVAGAGDRVDVVEVGAADERRQPRSPEVPNGGHGTGVGRGMVPSGVSWPCSFQASMSHSTS